MRGYADNFGAAVHVEDVLALERVLFLGYVPTAVLQAWLHPADRRRPRSRSSARSSTSSTSRCRWRSRSSSGSAAARLLRLRRGDDRAVDGGLRDLPAAAGRAAVVGGRRARGPAAGVEYLKEQGFAGLAALFGFEGGYLFTLHDLLDQPEPGRGLPVAPCRLPVPRVPVRPPGVRAGRLADARLLGRGLVLDRLPRRPLRRRHPRRPGLRRGGVLGGHPRAGWFRGRGRPGRGRQELARPRSDVRRSSARARRCSSWRVVAAMRSSDGRTGARVGAGSPLFLVPWFVLLGGLWRAAAAL